MVRTYCPKCDEEISEDSFLEPYRGMTRESAPLAFVCEYCSFEGAVVGIVDWSAGELIYAYVVDRHGEIPKFTDFERAVVRAALQSK